MESYSVPAAYSKTYEAFANAINEAAKALQNIQKVSQSSADSITKISSAVEVFQTISAEVGKVKAAIGEIGSVGDAFKKIIDIGNKTAGMFDAVVEKSRSFASALKELPEKSLNGIAKLKENLNQVIPDNLAGKIQSLSTKMNERFARLGDSVAQIAFRFDTVTGRFAEDGPKIWKVVDSIREKGEVISDSLSEEIGEITDKIADRLKALPGKALNGITKLKDNLTRMIPDNLAGKIQSLSTKMNERFARLGDSVARIAFRFDTVTGRFAEDGPKIWKVVDSIRDKVETFTDSLKELPGKARSGISKLKEGLTGIVPDGLLDKFRNLSSGIGESFSALKDRVSSKFEQISKVGDALGKGLKAGVNVGMQAMNGMVSALTSVMSVAIRMVGPAAVLGIVLAGLGVLQGQFGQQINGIIQTVTTQGPQIIQGLVDSIVSGLPALMQSGSQILAGLMNAITANLPVIMQGGLSILTSLIQGVINNLPVLIPAALSLITTFATSIITALPQILMLGLELLMSLVTGLTENLDLVINSVLTIIDSIVTGLTENLPIIIEQGLAILMALAQGIIEALPQIIVAAVNGLTAFVNTISENLPQIIETGVQIIQMLVNGLIQNLPAILSAVVTLIGALVNGIISNLPGILAAGLEIIVTLASGLLQALPHIASAMLDIISSIGESIGGLIDKALSWGKDFIGGLADGIVSGVKRIIDTVKGLAEKICSFLHFSRPDKGPLRSYEQWMPDFMKGLAAGITGSMGLIESAVTKVAGVMDFSMDAQITPNISAANFTDNFTGQLAYAGTGYLDGELNSDFNYRNDFQYTVIVPLDIEGREVARATASYTQEELEKIQKINNRKAGYR